jgi:hypothetical protein
VSNLIMSELAPLVNAQYGVFYVTRREEDEGSPEAGREPRVNRHGAIGRHSEASSGCSDVRLSGHDV